MHDYNTIFENSEFLWKNRLFQKSDFQKSHKFCVRRKNAKTIIRILQLYHLLESKSKKQGGIRGSQGDTHMVSGPSGVHVWGPEWFLDGFGSR